MRKRILTGIIGGTILLTVWYLGGNWFRIAMSILALIAYHEVLSLKKIRFWSWHGFAGMLLVLIVLILYGGQPTHIFSNSNSGVLFAGFFIYFLLLTVVSRNRISFDDISFMICGGLYILFGFMLMIDARLNVEHGATWVLFIWVLTWATDTGAFIFGKIFGKNKLSPVLSPNKTVEGSLGGMFLPILFGLIFAFFSSMITYVQVILIAPIVSIAAQFGDLVQSAMKRHYNVKDTGSILPGHGGILDRFDSLLFVFLILYVFQIL